VRDLIPDVLGIEVQQAVGARAYDLFLKCFEDGLLVRQTGDVIALSPPLIVEKAQIDRMVEIIGNALKRLG